MPQGQGFFFKNAAGKTVFASGGGGQGQQSNLFAPPATPIPAEAVAEQPAAAKVPHKAFVQPEAAQAAPPATGGGTLSPEDDYRQNGTKAKAFLAWFGPWDTDPANASKVVNAKGEPQETQPISGEASKVMREGKPVAVYHGGRTDFNAFDPKLDSGQNLFGPGFYFTEDKSVAAGTFEKQVDYVRHDTEEQAKAAYAAAKQADPSLWQASDPFQQAFGGKWLAAVGRREELTRAGYAQKGVAITLGQKSGIAASIRQQLTERGPGYLSRAETERVNKSLDTWEKTPTENFGGSLDYLTEEVGGQPYNLKVMEAAGRAGVDIKGHVHEVYLNIRNPFDLEEGLDRGDVQKLTDRMGAGGMTAPTANAVLDKIQQHPNRLSEKSYTGHEVYEAFVQYHGGGNDGKAMTNALLRHAGHDGLTHTGGNLMGNGHEHKVWIAFEPSQVKSTANSGHFDPANPDIRMSRFVTDDQGRRVFRMARDPEGAGGGYFFRNKAGKVVHAQPGSGQGKEGQPSPLAAGPAALGLAGPRKRTGIVRPVTDEAQSARGLGRLTLDTDQAGNLDPNLVEAYRRHLATTGHTLGEFKVNPATKLATAPVTHGSGSPGGGGTPATPPANFPSKAFVKPAAASIAPSGPTAVASPTGSPATPVKETWDQRVARMNAEADRVVEQRRQQLQQQQPAGGARGPRGSDKGGIFRKLPDGRTIFIPGHRVRGQSAKPQSPVTPATPASSAPPPEAPLVEAAKAAKVERTAKLESMADAAIAHAQAHPSEDDPSGVVAAVAAQSAAHGEELQHPAAKAAPEPQKPVAEPVKAEAAPKEEKPAEAKPEPTLKEFKAKVKADAKAREAAKSAEQEKTKKEPQREGLQSIRQQIHDYYRESGGGLPPHIQQELENMRAAFVVYKGSPRASEFKEMQKEGGVIDTKGGIQWTDNPREAGAEDAIGELTDKYGHRGDEYYRQAFRERAGTGFHDAMEHTRQAAAAGDDRAKWLVRLHDDYTPGKKDVVPAEKLGLDDHAILHGDPIKVTLNEDGEKVVEDGGTFPTVPLAALHGVKLPLDKGSLHHEEPELPPETKAPAPRNPAEAPDFQLHDPHTGKMTDAGLRNASEHARFIEKNPLPGIVPGTRQTEADIRRRLAQHRASVADSRAHGREVNARAAGRTMEQRQQRTRELLRKNPGMPYRQAWERSLTMSRDTEHKYSSTQVNLRGIDAERVLKLAHEIPDHELAEDGRETEPHVTLKYGLHADSPDPVRAALAGEPPIRLRLGKVSIFPANDKRPSDVVKVDVDSPDLHRLNKKVADGVPHTDTYPDYHPHLTLGYVKPGMGKKYEGRDDLAGRFMLVDRVRFSAKDGCCTDIPLSGKTQMSRTVPGQGYFFKRNGKTVFASAHSQSGLFGGGQTAAVPTAAVAEAPKPTPLPFLRGAPHEVAQAMDRRAAVLPKMEAWVASLEGSGHPKAKVLRGQLDMLKRSREARHWLPPSGGEPQPSYDPHGIGAAMREDRARYGIPFSRDGGGGHFITKGGRKVFIGGESGGAAGATPAIPVEAAAGGGTMHAVNAPEGADRTSPHVEVPQRSGGPTVHENGVHFETGRAVTFPYIRNTERSPQVGETYQQHIEPAGRYLLHDTLRSSDPPPGWEQGQVTFDNPLVVHWNSADGGYDANGWKAQLSQQFRGKTGKALSRAIAKAGHDGIVTVRPGRKGGPSETSEIVDLTSFKRAKSFNQSAPAHPGGTPMSRDAGQGYFFRKNGKTIFASGPKQSGLFDAPDAAIPAEAGKPQGQSLPDFAAHVQRLGDSHPVGLGDNKVYLGHVQAKSGMAPEAFKARVKEAAHAGLLKVSRADLPLDPAEEAKSEIDLGAGGTAHYLQVSSKQRTQIAGVNRTPVAATPDDSRAGRVRQGIAAVHEHTLQEYREKQAAPTGYAKAPESVKASIDAGHAKAVRDAVAGGETIHPEVARDYPEKAKPPVDNARQLGLHKDAGGNHPEVGAALGQSEMFGTQKPAPKAIEPKPERVGSRTANDPKNTAPLPFGNVPQRKRVISR